MELLFPKAIIGFKNLRTLNIEIKTLEQKDFIFSQDQGVNFSSFTMTSNIL